MTLFIIADALRYDYAKRYLFDEIFEEESHKKIHCDIAPCTRCCLPTLVTGQPYKIHQCSNFSGKPILKSPHLFEPYSNHITISRLLGAGPFFKTWAKRENPKMFPNIPFNAITDNDEAVYRYVIDDQYDLILYHSWLTHGPYGISNWTGYMNKCIIEKVEEYRDLSTEALKQSYKCGVLSLKERVKLLSEMTDRPIVLTSDHGEFLREDGKYGHIGFIGDNDPAIKEIPLMVNRDVDLDDIEEQWDVKKLVWRVSGV